LKPLVVFGAGDIAEIAHFYLTRDAGFQVEAFAVDREFLKEPSFCGRPVVALEELETRFPAASCDAFVALSYARLNALRAEKCAALKAKGYRLVSYVSSRATTWPGLACGENCFILEDNTIQPFVHIGNNVTLWSGNHIGHHSRIADNCFVASHVVISGGVEIGENCFIGVNATLRDHVKIGRNCVIGAGALIQQDAADNSVYTQPAAELSRVPSNRLRRI
jgi:sugar O-acyltransferase (sialic acid O-acetyltransferase NeuD family)